MTIQEKIEAKLLKDLRSFSVHRTEKKGVYEVSGELRNDRNFSIGDLNCTQSIIASFQPFSDDQSTYKTFNKWKFNTEDDIIDAICSFILG
jgi:hypothetical protein